MSILETHLGARQSWAKVVAAELLTQLGAPIAKAKVVLETLT
jgi:hypothetical protein